ncbi:conserved hypothetical protein [Ricinus communis]|uniref:Uncharacterized protein n=1 Tax=Ricinus communis TaxID=3988 RepID=B9TMM8_RICCO|nr:conserved hypothetical protein [Ricinus communis]
MGNLTNGKIGVIRWSWENGRIFQIPALFMLGMLAARKGLFTQSLFWRRALVMAVVLFIPFYVLKTWPELLGVALAGVLFAARANEFNQLRGAVDDRHVDLLWLWSGHVPVHRCQFCLGDRRRAGAGAAAVQRVVAGPPLAGTAGNPVAQADLARQSC